MTPEQILNFWFDPNSQSYWFHPGADFDAEIRQRFHTIWQQAARAELSHWRSSLSGRRAEIILLDQFSRHLHRGSAQAFSQDGMAVVLTQEALRQPGIAALSVHERQFLLLPLMHSESLWLHQQARPLFQEWTTDKILALADSHRAIIERFGRYPQRNALLGRPSTSAEIQYLLNGGRLA